MWQHTDDPIAEFLLIMCYSGYRITAYRTIEVNLEEQYFKGGVKTKASKNRTVPIHPAIFPLVKTRLKRNKKNENESFLEMPPNSFGKKMKSSLKKWDITTYHTPHDCRHTFSCLCEKYKVNENDRKRMLGHSFGTDITNQVYGHRSFEELRTEIKKIKVCY